MRLLIETIRHSGMNSAGLNLKIVLFKRRIEVAESKPSTGRISKAKAKEIELAQKLKQQKKQARQKIIRLAWDLVLWRLWSLEPFCCWHFGITHGALVDKTFSRSSAGLIRTFYRRRSDLHHWMGTAALAQKTTGTLNLGRLLMVEFGLFTLLGALSAF